MFNKIKRIFTFALALSLALIMGLEYPAQVSAESLPQYVKEIKMVTASTKEEAARKLEDAGYTVCDINLRDGVDGNVCYIGYKSTTDKSEAITDIRLMNAKGGITEENYRKKKAEWTSGIAKSTEYFKDAVLELKEKYEAGSPLAAAAVGILDIFDFDGTSLSTYLFSSSRTDADYEDIILICADNVISAIYSAIILGCADYGETNFADRIGSIDASDYTYDKIEATEGNEQYAADWDNVERILENLQDFGSNYDLGVVYFEDEENIKYLKSTYGSSDSGSSSEMTDAQQTEYWKKFVDDYYKNSEDEEEQDLYKYASAIGAYKKLEQYESPDTQYNNLAEYIYACTAIPGTSDKETKTQIYSIYPLVEALTPGQIFTLQYGGVESLVNTLDNNTDTQSKKIAAVTDEVKSKVQSNGVDTISVFYNVNRDIYDKTVCFTDEATKEAVSNGTYDKLTYVETDDELTQNLTKAILICGMVAASILAVTVLAMSITAAIAGTTMATLFSVGFTAIMAGSIGVALGGMSLTSGAVVMGIIGVTSVVLALLFIAVIVVCVLIMVFRKIKKDNDEEEETMPDIPQQIYDVNKGDFICYNAVTDTDGNPVNFTCRDAVKEQWDVMYVSTEAKSDPIAVNDGQVFEYCTDVTAVPSDATAVRRFESISPANFNSFQSSPKHSLYLYYNSTGSGSEEEEGDGETTYIYSLALATEDSAEAARLYLENKGFTPIEKDITPCTSKISYIGYKTTTNPDDAVTDIRVAYYYSADEFTYGTLKNGVAAKYTKFGTLNTQASLYYTKQHSNGSPILTDIKFSSELLGADSGYEGINLFSGGEAFNFINGSDNYSGIRCLDDNWNDTFYIYFKPSETYGSDSPEYLSGFAFSSGYDNCMDSAKMCGFKVVPALDGYNLTDGLTEQPTYIMYSTTHNPYRAITEIRTYEAGNKATGLYENLAYGQVGFAACETFACIHNDGTADFWNTYKHRLLRPSNAFITRLEYEGAVRTYLSDDLEAQNNLGYYDSVPLIGLYVAGPNENKDPLTFDDVYFSTDRYDTDRTSFVNSKGNTVQCRPVSDLTDCYSTSARNMTFEWAKRSYITSPRGGTVQYCATEVTFSHYLRMYYKGSVPTRGKYVKSVVVSSVNPEGDSKNYSYDQAMAQLLAQGEGEIKQVNLSRSSSSQPVTYETYTDENGKSVKRETVRDYTGKSTYVMVTYSDTIIGSLRSIVSDWNSDDVKSKAKIKKIQGAEFNICGDAVQGQTGDYLLYSTSNGYFGSPVTDIIISGDYLANGCLTISAIDKSLHTGEDNAIKLKYDGGRIKGYIKNVCITFQSSFCKCYKDLYERGCTAAITEDKNQKLGGNYVIIGYATTGDRTDPDLVTDIKVSVESKETSQSSYTDSNTGMYYERISKDMNDDRGGDYTYLYVSKTTKKDPLTGLSSYHLITETLSDYTDYYFNKWEKTENASSGTGKEYNVVFTRMDYSSWTLSNDGTLTINAYGKLPEYTESKTVTFPRSDWNNGDWKTVNETVKISMLPEWYESRSKIRSVNVGENVTYFTANALIGCENVEEIRIYNSDCQLQEYSIPGTAILYGYQGSWAEGYAANEIYDVAAFMYLESLSGTTMLGDGNLFVISGISFIMIVIGAAFMIVKKKKEKSSTISEGNSNTESNNEEG